MPHCNKCQARTIWVMIEATGDKPARTIPLDAVEDRPDEPAVPAERSGQAANVVLTGAIAPDGVTPLARHTKGGAGLYACHWATCPERQQKKHGKPPAAPVELVEVSR